MNTSTPIVTVICLCFNHARFLREALNSVFEQSYDNIQIIIVDDGSTDGSVMEIHKFLEEKQKVQNTNKNILFIENATNIGNCAAFNKAFVLANGKYIIDFATDDVMLPNRIWKQVEQFEKASDKVGVIYSDAVIIDENSMVLGMHSDKYKFQPEGDIYQYVLRKYFICPPTMMIKKQVLDEMGGYDATLAFEDFDFWIRSARNWHYAYDSSPLTQRREVANSHGKNFFKRRNKIHETTYKVCGKAFDLNGKGVEFWNLAGRCIYEGYINIKAGNYELIIPYVILLLKCIIKLVAVQKKRET
ncbi:MAG: glycosyltransferase [Bacteroidota bacterium]|nr:glycosyltransferase [Bacteroidota bacterium]